ncbi:FAD/NAD(P)-binding protein [Pareuzebyella sediminis]|uniref:FAD/NAD(P)-binding protein n=1 Tax=Pareuzebyella sediminis TaxID=2607998 RepID=UPI0011EEC64F|nr:FAD/NAD(P)-binding protein [Pareuzebyella sediminis]
MSKIEKNTYTVAIIGAGPRGLSALESLYTLAFRSNIEKEIKVILFEQTDQVGNGPVYHRNQPDTNWLNVSQRGLTIPERKAIKNSNFAIPHFPSYHEWSGFDEETDTGSKPDYFTKRSQLGVYLSQRFDTIANKLNEIGLLEIHQEKVVNLDYSTSLFIIETTDNRFVADEVVLTVGHQPTELDEQLTKWKALVEGNSHAILITYPYPVSNIAKNVQANDIIALRGFGLAMVDVTRALTLGLGGSFEILDYDTRKMLYTPSEGMPIYIVPFSLNGLPMTPKPLNLNLDTPFIPSKAELIAFKERLEDAIRGERKNGDGRFLIVAITPLIVKKFLGLGNKGKRHNLLVGEVENVVQTWLEDGSFEHELIISKTLSAYESMQAFVNMATGNTVISLDYCIGQVWRHCQPSIYRALSFTSLPDEIITEIIQLDERLKRYSYGPPVDSMTQMIALVDAGVMTFDFIDDPDIEFNEKGWKFSKNDKNTTARVMVDTVLDSPKLLKVKSPLVKNLLRDSLIEPIHGQLGISTEESALVKLNDRHEIIPLAVLGRLAKGTIIGVDALLECFGERSEKWAEGVLRRI